MRKISEKSDRTSTDQRDQEFKRKIAKVFQPGDSSRDLFGMGENVTLLRGFL